MEPDEIMDPALPETIQQLCEEAGITPSRLRIEMTERTILSDPAGVSAAVNPIDRIQSYHYSKPLPADEFTAFITEHNV